jgi:hypothetical protein
MFTYINMYSKMQVHSIHVNHVSPTNKANMDKINAPHLTICDLHLNTQ